MLVKVKKTGVCYNAFMKALIFVGGKQTRIGFSSDTKPKSLLEINKNDTVLFNLIKQLDIPCISEIVVFPGDNYLIEKYLGEKLDFIKTKVTINKIKLPKLGHYIFTYKEKEPVTFIFGDMYVPFPQLTNYMNSAYKTKNSYSSYLGVSDSHVGDYRVQLGNENVIDINERFGNKFTCGLFTILDTKIIQVLKRTDKLTDTFAQIPRMGYKMGFFEIVGAIDIDTPDSLSKIYKV